jgi:hypothetical protein
MEKPSLNLSDEDIFNRNFDKALSEFFEFIIGSDFKLSSVQKKNWLKVFLKKHGHEEIKDRRRFLKTKIDAEDDLNNYFISALERS